MYIIGLTGGIGSGKSTIAEMFQALGVPVFDTDDIARQVVSPGQPALDDIEQTFGPTVISENGTLDRARLRHIVFNDDTARHKLESLLHPRIQQTLLRKIDGCTAAYCVAVIPLLVEKNWQPVVNRVLVADIPEHLQIERASQRDQLTQPEIQVIMNNQVSRDTRLSWADDVIDNSANLESLRSQVTRLHNKYLELSKTP